MTLNGVMALTLRYLLFKFRFTFVILLLLPVFSKQCGHMFVP